MERITHVAIRYVDYTASRLPPARHHDIIRDHYETHGCPTRGEDEQGFLTSEGRFVDRVLGLAIAKRAGQVVEKCGNPNLLFSEDMW